jgi:hypothetical protein
MLDSLVHRKMREQQSQRSGRWRERKRRDILQRQWVKKEERGREERRDSVVSLWIGERMARGSQWGGVQRGGAHETCEGLGSQFVWRYEQKETCELLNERDKTRGRVDEDWSPGVDHTSLDTELCIGSGGPQWGRLMGGDESFDDRSGGLKIKREQWVLFARILRCWDEGEGGAMDRLVGVFALLVLTWRGCLGEERTKERGERCCCQLLLRRKGKRNNPLEGQGGRDAQFADLKRPGSAETEIDESVGDELPHDLFLHEKLSCS